MAEEVKVNVVQIETGESVDNLKKLKSEIKKLKSDLLALDEGSKEYNETLSQLADAQFKMKDIQEKSQRAMMDTGEILANVSGLAGTATSAMAGFEGVLQLIGGESDEMQKLTQNIISLMAVAQSFSAIEDGIDRFKNLKIAIAGATKSISKLKLALGGLGIGVAITGITLLISKLSEVNKEQAKYNEIYDDFKDSASDSLVLFKQLCYQYQQLGDDLYEKKKFVNENAEAFDRLGISVNNHNDADNVFINNTKGVEQALIARAKAEVLAEKLKEQFKIQAENLIEKDRDKSKDGWFKNTIREFTDDIAGIGQLMGFNWKTSDDKLNEKIDETDENIVDLQEQIRIANEEVTKLFKELGLDGGGDGNNGGKMEDEVETLEDYLEVLKQVNAEKLKTVAEPNNDLKPFDAEADKENKQGKIDDLQNDSDIQTLKAKTAMMNSLIEASEKEKKEILENWALEDLKIQESENVRQMEILDLSHTYGLMSEEEYQRQKHELLYESSQISVSIAEEEAKKIEEKREGIKQGLKMIYDQVPQLLGAIQGTLDTSSKKGFETNKKIEKTQATLNYLSSMGGAYKSVMNAGIPVPYNFVVLATVLGMVTATFAANMKKINNLKFNGGGASIGGSSPSMPSISDSAVNALNKPNIGNTRLTFSEGDIENLPAQKVYVLSSEIEDSLNMRKTTIRNSTF